MSAAGQSLRTRLTAVLLAGFCVAWSIAALASYRDAHREIDRLLDSHLRQSAALLTAQLSHELSETFQLAATPGSEASDLLPYEQKVAYQAWRDGVELASRSSNAPATRFSEQQLGFSDVQQQKRRWRVFSGWDRDHRWLIQVGEDLAVRERIARSAAIDAILPMLLALPLLGLLVGWSVSRALAPLRRLSAEVARQVPGSLQPIGDRDAPAEIQPLIDRLNELFARTRQSMEQQRRFTANAAHELRNPLAALQAQAEVARGSNDALRSRHALDAIITGCGRLTRLVEQLLTLARVEETSAPRSACRLDELARSAVADLAPQAIAAGQDIACEADTAVTLQGNLSLLDAAIRNLLDNALRHGGAGVHVTIRIESSGDEALIEVRDDGPGVAPDALARLGERFNREQASDVAGSGLGLALVRQIAAWHGGRVEFAAASADGRGLCARMHLPLAPR